MADLNNSDHAAHNFREISG